VASEHGELLIAGQPGQGPALVLSEPISFWGGIDPASGIVIDPRHPQHGASVAGAVLFLPGTIGSSSASAVLMELVHRGKAPAAIVLHEADAILLIGLISAVEMGWRTPIAVRLERMKHQRFEGSRVIVDADGTVRGTK
jgi:predicted aconitase with swiveling domain